MITRNQNIAIRWLYLGLGVITMLFAGILYAWSILKAPFTTEFGWSASDLALNFTVAMCFFCKPSYELHLPQPKLSKVSETESFQSIDYTPRQMVRRSSFWMAFLCLVFLSAVGSSVISFAKDLALSVNAPEVLAVTLVGVLSVCNGLGRILTGAVFDAIGRRKTMICANILTICAAGITLLAVSVGSLPLCVLGLCLTGMSYGSCPTITAAFTSAFFGMKHYSTNVALMTFNVMGGSLIATISSKVLESFGGYAAPFLLLLILTVLALLINIFIRNP